MRIEPARAEDLPAILAIERETPEAPHWGESAYRVALLGGKDGLRRCLFAAWVAEEIVGFAVGSVVAGAAELESVAVRAMARRRGAGKALCVAVIAWGWEHGAETVELEVRAGSAGARGLYAGLGFVECGRRPDYYREPVEDAVRMRMRLRRETVQEHGL